MTTAEPRRLAVFLPDLSGGGVERLHLQLAPQFQAAGLRVAFVLARGDGALLSQVPKGVEIVDLGAGRQLSALPKLAYYLRRQRPDVLIANTEHGNVIAILSRSLARVQTRIIASQHNAFSHQARRPSWQYRVLPLLYRLVLPMADHVVAVSNGVAADLVAATGLSPERIAVIHNGIALPGCPEADARKNLPTILAMGRLVPQKDFETLLLAFAAIADRSDVRLVILGEGPMRRRLEQLVFDLGLEGRVTMPGFATDPYPHLRRAAVFVLSSRFEGFGNVLVEALACGTPVVSTDCPYGPAEILEDGRYGLLVPVGDPAAMGEAILQALARTPDRLALRQRAEAFGIEACAANYLELMR